jgi:hypothetical protein
MIGKFELEVPVIGFEIDFLKLNDLI